LERASLQDPVTPAPPYTLIKNGFGDDTCAVASPDSSVEPHGPTMSNLIEGSAVSVTCSGPPENATWNQSSVPAGDVVPKNVFDSPGITTVLSAVAHELLNASGGTLEGGPLAMTHVIVATPFAS
jgi:hypothetical protein